VSEFSLIDKENISNNIHTENNLDISVSDASPCIWENLKLKSNKIN